MVTAKKFSSKIDEKLLDALREMAKDSGVDISSLLEEAVKDLINKKQMRPVVLKEAEKAMEEFSEAFQELAK